MKEDLTHLIWAFGNNSEAIEFDSMAALVCLAEAEYIEETGDRITDISFEEANEGVWSSHVALTLQAHDRIELEMRDTPDGTFEFAVFPVSLLVPLDEDVKATVDSTWKKAEQMERGELLSHAQDMAEKYALY